MLAGADKPSDAAALQRRFDDWLESRTKAACRQLRTRFGEHILAIDFHDPDLAAAYGRALKHASAGSNAAAAITLHVISDTNGGFSLHGLGWSRSDFGLKRVVPGWSDEHRTTFLLRTEAGIALVNWQEGRGYVWIPDRCKVPWWEQAAPFRWLMDRMAQRLGLCTLHAGLVGRDGRGVLFAGPGGAGKSTLALACIGLGLDYLADDYCLLAQAGAPICFNLYSSAKFSKDARTSPAWLDCAPSSALDQRGEKSILFLDELDDARIASRASVSAIVLPWINTGGNAKLRAATPQEAFRRLAPSTIGQSEADGGYVAARIARLVKTVPAFHLDMPPRAEDSAQAVAGLLDHVAVSTTAAKA